MKTPDEIKKSLEPCKSADPEVCPYCDLCTACENDQDALAYIKQLESNDSQVKKALSDNGFASLEAFLQAYNQVRAERDAMIESLRKSKACCVCANRNTRIPNKNAYDITAKCIRCVCGESHFEWRGVCEENGRGIG